MKGDWTLWIYCCYWNFFLKGEYVGDSKSEKGIQNTVREMDGQSLVRVTANHLPGHTIFEFDLGGRLTTRPYDKRYEVPSEQWFLYEPAGDVLAFRADGMYSRQPGGTSPNQERWQPYMTNQDRNT